MPASNESAMILHTESHGAMVFFFLWSLWVARRHLKEVWQQVHTGTGDAATVGRYRMAVAGMIVSAIYILVWALRLGVSLPLALGAFGFLVVSYFVTVKLVAASGVAYIYPNRPYIKGESFFVELVGSGYFSPQRLVPFKVFTNFAFFGTFNIPAWPGIAHHLRIFSLRRQPRWVTAVVVIVFPIGFVLAAGMLVGLCYAEGGSLYVGHRTEVFLRWNCFHHQQSYQSQPGALGGMVLRADTGRGNCTLAGAVSLVPGASHRPDLPADPCHLVALDQLLHSFCGEVQSVALRRRQGVPGGQALFLRSGCRLCHRGGTLEHRGHDLVSRRRPPDTLAGLRRFPLFIRVLNIEFAMSRSLPQAVGSLTLLAHLVFSSPNVLAQTEATQDSLVLLEQTETPYNNVFIYRRGDLILMRFKRLGSDFNESSIYPGEAPGAGVVLLQVDAGGVAIRR